MIDSKKVLAIIPARGGSKRLPRKNILPLAGKPLIAWTIEAAIHSKIFDEVMVNTDDEEIAEISKKFGASVPFIRPDELATDTSSSIDVVKDTLQWYQARDIYFTEFVLLQPTSPLRDHNAIVGAWQLYLQSGAESVISVCEVEHPIQWTFKLNTAGVMSSMFDDNAKRSQDYESIYRLNGAVYITKSNLIRDNNEIISSKKSVAYIMDQKSSIDIDCDFDFDFAGYFLDRME
jgi:CMP-N-acetylneuraminic acid synthetase